MGERIFSCFKGGVIGENFIGRQDYLKKLQQLYEEERPVHVALYGLPHVGKTSILQEWIRKLTEETSNSDIVIEHTIPNADSDGTYGFSYVMRFVLRSIVRQIRQKISVGQIEKTFETDEMMNRILDFIREDVFSADSIVTELENAILLLSGKGIRTIIVLDEFERVGQSWNEDEYVSFATLLLNRKLNLMCVVASRPHISYVVNPYRRKIIPFLPYLVESFSDDDMELFFQKVNVERKSNISKDELEEILYSCGRNPYLLTVMASDILDNPASCPKQLYKENIEKYEVHFKDVVQFMLYEEQRENKSFSHIVKCYFGMSDDYSDIIGTYIELGYIEVNDFDSKYTYKCERYVLKIDGIKKGFITVCPAFVNYLYSNELDDIKDVRDLLTGLVHSVRDITKMELERLYKDSIIGWNTELLIRMKVQGRKRVEYFAQMEDTPSWEVLEWERMSSTRKNWVAQHKDEMIRVSMPSLNFAVQTVNEKENVVMPVLDPISIVDNGYIILKYPKLFSRYFVQFGDIEDVQNARALINKLKRIQEARNEISHFSRYGFVQAHKDDYRKICIDILTDIYREYQL